MIFLLISHKSKRVYSSFSRRIGYVGNNSFQTNYPYEICWFHSHFDPVNLWFYGHLQFRIARKLLKLIRNNIYNFN